MLFLVEGFPSVIVAVIAFAVIPDSPGTATYLTQRERRVASLRLRREKEHGVNVLAQRRLNFREILQTLIDPKAYITAVSTNSFGYLKRLVPGAWALKEARELPSSFLGLFLNNKPLK